MFGFFSKNCDILSSQANKSTDQEPAVFSFTGPHTYWKQILNMQEESKAGIATGAVRQSQNAKLALHL